MAEVDYTEKQFEVAADIELGLAGANVFSPGQVAEAILGYDAAVNVPTASSAREISRILGRAPGRGLRLAPNHWHACNRQPRSAWLPGRWISLIVQWKRPEVLRRPPLPGWRGVPPPYYRFAYRRHQQDILETLEVNLRGKAIVVYGSPAIPDSIHLETAQVRRRILALTHFIEPSAGSGHAAWTYRFPVGVGLPNESGPPAEGTNYEGLLARLRAAEASRGTILAYLNDLGASLLEEPRPLTDDAAQEISPEQQLAIQTLGIFSAFLGDLGASWWLYDLDAEK